MICPCRWQEALITVAQVPAVGEGTCYMLPGRIESGEHPRAVVVAAQRMTDAQTGGVDLVVSLVTVTCSTIACIHRGHRSHKWLKHVNGGKKQCACVRNTEAFLRAEHAPFLEVMQRAMAALEASIDETVAAVFDETVLLPQDLSGLPLWLEQPPLP